MATERHAPTVPAQASRDALIARFSERAGTLGVRVHRMSDVDGVAGLVAELAGGGGVAVAPTLAAAQDTLVARLRARQLALVEVNVADPAATFDRVTVGVSEALLGLAETGSLVITDQLPDRLVRMLSPKHVVVLRAAWIVPGLDEAGAFLRESLTGAEGTPARYVSFITGPSRTADIEMSLTVGAHGPAELHIAMLEELVG